MTPKERFKPFAAALGKRLSRLGFPEKIVFSNHCFKLKTDSGCIGIFVIPNYRTDSGYSVSMSCAVSNSVVQDILVRTELYRWDGGLTWTCGADLRTVRNQAGAIRHPRSWTDKHGRTFFDLEELERLNRIQDVWINLAPSPTEYDRLADLAWRIVEGWAWPLFQNYGFGHEALLKLCLRNDEYSKMFFLEPRKPLTGMILARHLGRDADIPVLVQQARRDYAVFASHGNHDPILKFERIARLIGFNV